MVTRSLPCARAIASSIARFEFVRPSALRRGAPVAVAAHSFVALLAMGGLLAPSSSFALDHNPPLPCPTSAARPVQVCFALDASGSVGSANFRDMKGAIAKAVAAATSVPQDGSVSLAFVIYSSTAELAVPMTNISSRAVAEQVADAVEAFPYLAQNTATGDAIALCALQFTTAPGQRHVINVVTDSDDAGYRGIPLGSARNRAVDMGVNVINGLGIGTSDAVLKGLKRFVWPAPASPFPADGFAVLIRDWENVPEGIAGMMSASTFMVSSSGPGVATPVTGTPAAQLTRLNSAPPAFDSVRWSPVHRKSDVRAARAFRCQDVADPLDRNGALKLGYVSADNPMPNVDEVTYNNCTSAFYRFTFGLPKGIKQICLDGRANVDDSATVYLNGHPLSPPLRATDLQVDRADSLGRPILSWPSQDQFGTSDRSLFRTGGINELVFGVASDISIEPTGVEFQAKIVALTIPYPTSFTINRGAAVTTSRTVVLHNSASEQPAKYMASESPTFSGAAWMPYSTAPQFVLNPGAGLHTVYLKFKGQNGASSTRSDVIELR